MQFRSLKLRWQQSKTALLQISYGENGKHLDLRCGTSPQPSCGDNSDKRMYFPISAAITPYHSDLVAVPGEPLLRERSDYIVGSIFATDLGEQLQVSLFPCVNGTLSNSSFIKELCAGWATSTCGN
jgi:hypothetical protein